MEIVPKLYTLQYQGLTSFSRASTANLLVRDSAVATSAAGESIRCLITTPHVSK